MKVLNCDLCAFTAPTSAKVKVHKLGVHSDLRSWACTFPKCNFQTKWKHSLKQHLNIHETRPESRKSHICTFQDCDYRAAAKHTLKVHMERRHTPGRKKEFHCTLCSSSFYSWTELDGHILSHVKEKRFQCNYCQYKAKTHGYLQRHVRCVHQRLVTFNCKFPGCTYGTSRKDNLPRQLKTHDPDLLVQLPKTPFIILNRVSAQLW